MILDTYNFDFLLLVRYVLCVLNYIRQSVMLRSDDALELGLLILPVLLWSCAYDSTILILILSLQRIFSSWVILNAVNLSHWPFDTLIAHPMSFECSLDSPVCEILGMAGS